MDDSTVEPTLAQVVSRMRDLEAQNSRLSQRLTQMEGTDTPEAGGPSASPEVGEPDKARIVTRRGALMALGGAAGGLGLAAGSSLLGAGPASAAQAGGSQGGALILGDSGSNANSASSSTQVITSAGVGLAGATEQTGQSGVEGQDLTSTSPYGYGVTGTSDGGIGVRGSSEYGHAGVEGTAEASTGYQSHLNGGFFSAGVLGDCSTSGGIGGIGVLGLGNSFGVYGLQGGGSGLLGLDSSGAVVGDSNDTDGVVGLSSAGDGVVGLTSADSKCGVQGVDYSSGGGIGVLASSVPGVALQVKGSAQFSTCGVATVKGSATKPKSAVTVTGVALTVTSVVLATPQATAGGAVAGVVLDVSAGSFTIHVTKAVTTDLVIAWFILAPGPQPSAARARLPGGLRGRP